MKKEMKHPDKIKVLFVVESFSTGVYSIVHDIACNIDSAHFEVLIIHSLREDSPKDYKKDFSDTGVNLLYIPMDTPRNLLKSIKAIRGVIKEFNPQVIHLHSSIAGAVGRIAAKHHFRGLLLYTPHGFSFLKKDVNRIKRLIFKATEKILAIFFGGTILAISKNEYNLAKSLTKHLFLISNFIDVRKIPSGNIVRKNTVMICGRISTPRNPSLFNAIALALPEVTFIWVGDGPLKDLITAPNITITGYLSRNEALRLVSEATIYLQTSLWEGLSVSILEAMALKKGVIASNIEANQELVAHKKTGFLCELDSLEDFVKSIKILLNDDKLRENFGEAGFTSVVENFDLPIAIKKYESLYSSSTQYES
ncbi:MAG: glycosyltransferase [Spirochaetia bacterium]|nr:glycosyltransferase [Spirochaetia bacterium]